MTIVLQQTADTSFLQGIEDSLNAHGRAAIGTGRVPVNFVLKDGGAVMGGMKAFCVGAHFFVSWLYVDAAVRKQGWGGKLMAAAEAEALRRGCTKIFVDTMSFQAPGFYERLGFAVCARIDGFYEGHDRIFYRRDL